MKYKIGLGINYWDDPYGLERILQSPIYDIVKVVYVIDGRYKGRQDKEEYKADVTRLIKYYPKIHYVHMRDRKQIDKRNKYWEFAEHDNLDFLIICDSDHIIEIDNDVFFRDLEIVIDFEGVSGFPISYNNAGIMKKTIKLYKKPFTFRHKQNSGPNISHSQIFDNYGKGKLDMLGNFQRWLDIYKRPVKGIHMIHDKSLRTKKRVDWDYVYFSNNPTR